MPTIEIPKDAETVPMSDIPGLFASSLHPELPKGTPREVVQLKKMPLSAALKKKWCGKDIAAFPVSFADGELATLQATCWHHLPELDLPVTEEEWQPYEAAFSSAGITDWQIVPDIENLEMRQMVLWHAAKDDHAKNVEAAVQRGELVPLATHSLLPIVGATGDRLWGAVVTVENLRAYAENLGFIARYQQDAARHAECLDFLKRQSDTFQYCEFSVDLEEFEACQQSGRYTMLAADYWFSKGTGERPGKLLGELRLAGRRRDENLPWHEPGSAIPISGNAGLREWHEEAFAEDLNRWIKGRFPRVLWKFPEAATPPSEPTKQPLPRQRHQEAEIMRVIRELGHDPKQLPAHKPGKPGVKSDVRKMLNFTRSAFDKAWERLRADGDLADS